jgi:hypothetical protein
LLLLMAYSSYPVHQRVFVNRNKSSLDLFLVKFSIVYESCRRKVDTSGEFSPFIGVSDNTMMQSTKSDSREWQVSVSDCKRGACNAKDKEILTSDGGGRQP